jgi:hypothetical protein
MVTIEFPWHVVFPRSRLWERARVRAQSESTTLTSYPLPPEEGEEVMCTERRLI